jgi:hypothetical protein
VHNVLLGSSQFPMLSVDTVFVFECSLSQSSVWSLKQKRGRKENLGQVCSSNSVQNKNSNQIHRSVSEKHILWNVDNHVFKNILSLKSEQFFRQTKEEHGTTPLHTPGQKCTWKWLSFYSRLSFRNKDTVFLRF